MCVTVNKPGICTTIQDLGRRGYLGSGFSPSGVMDKRAARIANLLVDNGENAPVLEFCLAGPTLRFTTNAFVLPMRNPFQVAKAVATISNVSNNRQVLTIGVGWSKDEFGLMGQDFHTRGKRCDEMVEVMRLLWSGEYVSYQGEHYRFDNVEANPRPLGHVPIWVGGISAPALRRAARLGDGWLSDLQPAADIVDSIRQIRAMRQDLGRDHLPFDVMATPMDVGDPDGFRRLEDEGVTHIIGTPWLMYYQGPTTLEQKKDSIKRYADEVIARCS